MCHFNEQMKGTARQYTMYVYCIHHCSHKLYQGVRELYVSHNNRYDSHTNRHDSHKTGMIFKWQCIMIVCISLNNSDTNYLHHVWLRYVLFIKRSLSDASRPRASHFIYKQYVHVPIRHDISYTNNYVTAIYNVQRYRAGVIVISEAC